MCQVLILTYNYEADSRIRFNLEMLGFEVLCSKDILLDILNNINNDILRAFPIVFFSHTLPNNLVDLLLIREDIRSKITYRIDMEQPLEEKLLEWKNMGLENSLGEDIAINDLREQLVLKCTKDNKKNISIRNVFRTNNDNKGLSQILENFSKRESKLFNIILERNGEFIARKEVARILWKEGTTESHLAQLSQLVSRIRMKIDKPGMPSESIITHWKLGYKMSMEIINMYNNHTDI